MKKTGCIVAFVEVDGSPCLFKNRDRNYMPHVRIIRALQEGVEVAYLEDTLTGWVEGINEYGIGVVNSALMVTRDETERDEVERTGRRLEDGQLILSALGALSVKEAAKVLKGKLFGHTIVSDAKTTVFIESPDAESVRTYDDDFVVRTNHGVLYPDAGYVSDARGESSRARMERAETLFSRVDRVDSIAPILMENRRSGFGEPIKDDPSDRKMRTTTQMVLDLEQKTLHLYLLPGRVGWHGVVNHLPPEYEPSINIRVYEYSGSEPVPVRTAAKYKDKKKVPKADGSGKTTVYVYSERQVANRHKEKAERIDKLRKSFASLRKKVQSDLDAKDAKKRLTALAVALIDATFERVGNSQSAEDGHFGVTGWVKKHLTFKGEKATIKYVGKSGVKHEKVVDDAKLVKALKGCCDDKGPDDLILSFGADDSEGLVSISSEDVNEYLSPFDITAKDLRGFHANRLMQETLKDVRSDGPKLPEDKKEREALLKEEFKDALKQTAEAVGHEAATLRSQYLVPGLEEEFMKDGTVTSTFKKDANVEAVVRLYLASKALDGLSLNTSNADKLKEYQRLGLKGLTMTHKDLKEVNADPYTVVVYKAKAIGPNVIIEDTSLDVEGEDVGVNVKWLLNTMDQHVGKRATFRVVIGLMREGHVELYEGAVSGTLVLPQGKGFGFDPNFVPDGSDVSLAINKSDKFNARAIAVRKLLKGQPTRKVPVPAQDWEGDWQKSAKMSPAEREDREARDLVKPSPTKKPPRDDRRQRRMKVDDGDWDRDKSQTNLDLSKRDRDL